MNLNDKFKRLDNRIATAFNAVKRSVKDADQYLREQTGYSEGDDSINAYVYKMRRFIDVLSDQVNGMYDEVINLEQFVGQQNDIDDGTARIEDQQQYLRRKRVYEQTFDFEEGAVISK